MRSVFSLVRRNTTAVRRICSSFDRTPTVTRFELGKKRGSVHLDVCTPSYVHDPELFGDAVAQGEKAGAIGDIVWPSSVALSERLVGGFGPLLEGRRIVEVGCGVGLTGLTAAKLGAAEVLCTDRDERVLSMVAASAEMNALPGVATQKVDWKDSSTWPAQGSADVILGADVLYHGHAHQALAELLEHLLVATTHRDEAGPRFALLMEPMHEERITATDGQVRVRPSRHTDVSLSTACNVFAGVCRGGQGARPQRRCHGCARPEGNATDCCHQRHVLVSLACCTHTSG